MMDLAQLQKTVLKDMFEDTDNSISCLESKSSLDAKQRLNIYRDSIYAGFSHVMAVVYPVCKQLVGDHFFYAMVEDYIKHNQPQSSDVTQYGQYFSDFVKTFKPAEILVYLSDVVKLEYLAQLAIEAKDEVSSRYEMTSVYPVLKIWEVNQDDYNGNGIVNLSEEGERLIIYRRDGFLRVERRII